MNNLDQILHIWRALYDKNQDPKLVIEEFFHKNYIQSINDVMLNRTEYINHVIEQRKNVKSMEFECKRYMIESDRLFIIYNTNGKNIQDDEIAAEIISYFEFKDKKILKIHGQVHLLKGNPSDVDMSQDNL